MAFCFHQNKYFACGFAFSAYNASYKSTICGFAECLIHYHGILQNIASDKATHFIGNGLVLMEFTGLTIISRILKELIWWDDEMSV